jgi:hypothetical protein
MIKTPAMLAQFCAPGRAPTCADIAASRTVAASGSWDPPFTPENSCEALTISGKR